MSAQEYEGRCGRGVGRMRRACKMTQGQLALVLGVSRQRVGELEQGQNAFRLRTLHALAAAFGMSPSNLLEELGKAPGGS